MTITCKCGHEDDMWNFLLASSPQDYQCPKCKWAFRRVKAPDKIYPNGFVMPGDISIVTILPGKVAA